MPKSKDKKKGTKRRKTPNSNLNTNSTEGSEEIPVPKRKKFNPDDGITKSKQLVNKLRNRTRNSNSATSKNSEPKICGNGKPMPSLAELERMYEDSDGDEEPVVTNKIVPEKCESPSHIYHTLADQKLPSPTMLAMATKVIDLISKQLEGDGPPPPVVPQKKQKKPDKPYIDGCKDRAQVPWQPKSVVGKSNDKYGIDLNADLSDDEENMCPKKRRKRSNYGNISKSIFNAQSDDIAAMLKECENVERSRNNSPDSNKTVSYEYLDNSPTRSIPRSFSPLPSTSRDSETILKNDQLFSESFNSENIPDDNVDIVPSDNGGNDVDIIEIPCETIIIDDSITQRETKVVEPLAIADDDCCVIVESDVKMKREPSPIKIEDDYYGTLDLTQNFDSDICEVIDVDDIIAENTAFIKKYRKESNLDTITCVDPNVSYVNNRRKSHEQNVTPSESNTVQNRTTTNVMTSDRSHNASGDICNTVQTTPNMQSNAVQASTTSNLCQDTRHTQASETGRNNIADVVTNFFNQTEDARKSSSSSIDLTGSQSSVINKISSWMSSIDSYLRGTQNTRQVQDNATPRNTNGTPRSRVNDVQVNVVNVPPNFVNVPTVINHRRPSKSQRRQRNNFVISSVINVPPDVTSITYNQQIQRVPPETPPPEQPKDQTPGRSFGDCPICMDSLANNAVASTLCGHVFCMDCIKAAIKANGKKCPTCRKALKGVGYHQLFL